MRSTAIRRFVLAALATALLGASACTPGYDVYTVRWPVVDPRTPRDAVATVCVLRPQSFGAPAPFLIFDNGQLVGLSRGARVYSCHLARPGVHRIVARSDNDAAAEVRLRAGQRVFLRLQVNVGADELFVLRDDEGVRLLHRLRYVVTERTSADVPAPARQPIAAR